MSATEKPPIQMTDDEIVVEIQAVRAAMDHGSKRLLELCRVLHARASRARVDIGNHIAPSLVAYANAWGRFGGLVGQAVRRTTTVERALDAAKKDSARRTAFAERAKKAAIAQAAEKEEEEDRLRKEAAEKDLALSEPQDSTDDLMELYGREVVLNAVAR